MMTGLVVSAGGEEGNSEFKQECMLLNSLAKEVGEINLRLFKKNLVDHTREVERRSKLMTSWWSEWLRILPSGRAAGVAYSDLRALQPPVL